MSDSDQALEDREPNEEALIARMEEVLRRKMERDYLPEGTRRDAHPKHTSLLAATFTVKPEVPPELRVGIFAEPRTYRAWVRTSSASGKPQSDAIKDVRGLAIKVVDVPGEKLPESDEPHSQDFILLNTPAMPLGTVRLFHDAIYYSTRWSPLLFLAKMMLTGQGAVLKELDAIKILPPSPLEIRYWSTTPYQLGAERVVKYSLLPTSGNPTALPERLTDHYLTDAVESRLAREEVTFDFALQQRRDGMSITDSRPRWDESLSPFVTVATLTIPAQAVRTEEHARLAEALSFSPAHARIEHRPVGSINRARMRIYRALSQFRHARRGLASSDGR
jgi:hypothetical protein